MKIYVVVLIRSALASKALLMSTHNICFMEIYETYVDNSFIDLELWISTWMRAKKWMNIFSINWLLVDDQSVLQNWWSTIKLLPIPNTTVYDNEQKIIFYYFLLWHKNMYWQ